MNRAAVILGVLPATVWFGIDYDELLGLHVAWNELHGRAVRSPIEPMNDYDRLLIADLKAQAAVPATS